jgi:hypothetical protein
MANDMVSGKKRNVKLLGREPKHFRNIKLLSHGIDAKIDPSRWAQVAGAKAFDTDGTAILRVSRHRFNDAAGFLIYGMRSKTVDGKATIEAEAYDMIALAEAVPALVAKVAAHCGVEALVPELKL